MSTIHLDKNYFADLEGISKKIGIFDITSYSNLVPLKGSPEYCI